MNLLLDKQEHSPPATTLASLPDSLVTHAGRLVHLEMEIGRGGDSTVYRATYEGRSEPVAVKIFDASVARQEQRMERLREEMEIAQRVDSPRLMASFDHGIAFGQYFMVMEYASGGNLQTYLDAHAPLRIEEIQALGIQLCEALSDLHGYSIIHRDVKPQNVLLMGDGTLKLSDFGVARQVVDGQISSTVSTVGTMAYIAPEQALGEPVGIYTDIYALGVTLFAMATNRLPFEAATPFAVALAHVKQSPPAPSRYRQGLPRTFDAIVLRCLSKEPRRRYATAGQLLEALTAMLAPRNESIWSRWTGNRNTSQVARRALNGVTVFGR